jgi:hypothetical protein
MVATSVAGSHNFNAAQDPALGKTPKGIVEIRKGY